MRTVGIIDGFGPETTAQFQLAIVDRCRAAGMIERPEILMWNAPIPLKIEENLIINDSGIDSFLPFLIRGARILERAGASFLVLPCNTLHMFVEDVREAVSIPVISIIDVTLKKLQTSHASQVAVIGTKATMDGNLYTSSIEAMGMTSIKPTPHEQTAIDQVIFDTLNNTARRRSTRILKAITDELRLRGARHILLACTDLQLVFPKISDGIVHDSLDILVSETTRLLN